MIRARTHRGGSVAAAGRRSVLRLLLALGLLALCAPGGAADATAGGRLGLFFESGVLAGGESTVPTYNESRFRVLTEAGVEWREAETPSRAGWHYGMAVSGALGNDDARLGLGPRITCPLRRPWSLQLGAGPLWSSEEEARALFSQGWHARVGLRYRSWASLAVLWHTLPYQVRGPDAEHGRLHSLHGGVMLQGTAGTIASTVIWGTLVALAILYVREGYN